MSGVLIDIDTRAESAKRDLKDLNKSLAQMISNSTNSSKSLDKISANNFKNVNKQLADSNKQFASFKTISSGSLNAVNKSASTLNNTLSSLTKSAIALGGAFIAVKGVTGFSKTADDLTRIQNRLKVVAGETESVVQLQARLSLEARNARGNLNELALVYTGLASSVDSSNKVMYDFSKTSSYIYKAALLSGSSTEAMRASLVQLNQGFSSGVLRGEELNSVAEGLSYYFINLAKTLGVTTGQMRKMAAEGLLTSDILLKATAKMSSQIDKDFGKLTLTVEQASNMMFQSFSKMVGSIGLFSGSPARFSNALMKISEKIEAFTAVFPEKVNTIKMAVKNYIATLDMFDAAELTVKGLMAGNIDFGDLKSGYEYYKKQKELLAKLREEKNIQPDMQEESTFDQLKKKAKEYAFTAFKLKEAIAGTWKVTKENLKDLTPLIVKPMITYAQMVESVAKQGFLEALAFEVEFLLPRLRKLQAVSERITLFALGDTELERTWVNLFNSKGLNDFISKLNELNDTRDDLSLRSKSFSLRYIFDELQEWYYVEKDTLIRLGFLDQQFFQIRQTRFYRFVRYLQDIGRVIARVYNDIYAVQLEKNLKQTAVVIEAYSSLISRAFINSFNETSGRESARILFDVFQDVLKGVYDLIVNFNFKDAFAKTFSTLKPKGAFKIYFDEILKSIKDFSRGFSAEFATLLVNTDFAKNVKAKLFAVKDIFFDFIKTITDLKNSITDKLSFKTFKIKLFDFSDNKAFRYFIDLFDRIYSYAKSKLPKVSSIISAFANDVKEFFFDIYDKVVGHSYWPDMVDGVVDYSKNILKSIPSLASYKETVINLFKAIYEEVINAGSSIGGAFGKFTDKLVNNDWTGALKDVFGSIGAHIGLFLMTKSDLVSVKLLGYTYFLSFLTGIEGAMPLLGNTFGVVAGKMGSMLLESLTTSLNLILEALPSFLENFIRGINPITDLLWGLTDTIAGIVPSFISPFDLINNKLIDGIVAAMAIYALTAKNGMEKVSRILFGKTNKDGSKAHYGVFDFLFDFDETKISKKLSKVFVNKSLAIAAAAALSTALLESITLVEAGAVAIPLLLVAIAGKDGGMRLLRDIVNLKKKILREVVDILASTVDKIIPFSETFKRSFNSLFDTLFTELLKPRLKVTDLNLINVPKVESNLKKSFKSLISIIPELFQNFKDNLSKYSSNEISLSEAFVTPVKPKSTSQWSGMYSAATSTKDYRGRLDTFSLEFSKTVDSIKTKVNSVLNKINLEGFLVNFENAIKTGSNVMLNFVKFLMKQKAFIVAVMATFSGLATASTTTFTAIKTESVISAKYILLAAGAWVSVSLAIAGFIALKKKFNSVKLDFREANPELYLNAMRKNHLKAMDLADSFERDFRKKRPVLPTTFEELPEGAKISDIRRNLRINKKNTEKLAKERNKIFEKNFKPEDISIPGENFAILSTMFDKPFEKMKISIDNFSNYFKTSWISTLKDPKKTFSNFATYAVDQLAYVASKFKYESSALSRFFMKVTTDANNTKSNIIAFSRVLIGLPAAATTAFYWDIPKSFLTSLYRFETIQKTVNFGWDKMKGLVKSVGSTIGGALVGTLKMVLAVLTEPMVLIPALGGMFWLVFFGPGNTFFDKLDYAADKIKEILGLGEATSQTGRLEKAKEAVKYTKIGDLDLGINAQLAAVDFEKLTPQDFQSTIDMLGEYGTAFDELNKKRLKNKGLADSEIEQAKKLSKEISKVLETKANYNPNEYLNNMMRSINRVTAYEKDNSWIAQGQRASQGGMNLQPKIPETSKSMEKSLRESVSNLGGDRLQFIDPIYLKEAERLLNDVVDKQEKLSLMRSKGFTGWAKDKSVDNKSEKVYKKVYEEQFKALDESVQKSKDAFESFVNSTAKDADKLLARSRFDKIFTDLTSDIENLANIKISKYLFTDDDFKRLQDYQTQLLDLKYAEDKASPRELVSIELKKQEIGKQIQQIVDDAPKKFTLKSEIELTAEKVGVDYSKVVDSFRFAPENYAKFKTIAENIRIVQDQIDNLGAGASLDALTELTDKLNSLKFEAEELSQASITSIDQFNTALQDLNLGVIDPADLIGIDLNTIKGLTAEIENTKQAEQEYKKAVSDRKPFETQFELYKKFQNLVYKTAENIKRQKFTAVIQLIADTSGIDAAKIQKAISRDFGKFNVLSDLEKQKASLDKIKASFNFDTPAAQVKKVDDQIVNLKYAMENTASSGITNFEELDAALQDLGASSLDIKEFNLADPDAVKSIQDIFKVTEDAATAASKYKHAMDIGADLADQFTWLQKIKDFTDKFAKDSEKRKVTSIANFWKTGTPEQQLLQSEKGGVTDLPLAVRTGRVSDKAASNLFGRQKDLEALKLSATSTKERVKYDKELLSIEKTLEKWNDASIVTLDTLIGKFGELNLSVDKDTFNQYGKAAKIQLASIASQLEVLDKAASEKAGVGFVNSSLDSFNKNREELLDRAREIIIGESAKSGRALTSALSRLNISQEDLIATFSEGTVSELLNIDAFILELRKAVTDSKSIGEYLFNLDRLKLQLRKLSSLQEFFNLRDVFSKNAEEGLTKGARNAFEKFKTLSEQTNLTFKEYLRVPENQRKQSADTFNAIDALSKMDQSMLTDEQVKIFNKLAEGADPVAVMAELSKISSPMQKSLDEIKDNTKNIANAILGKDATSNQQKDGTPVLDNVDVVAASSSTIDPKAQLALVDAKTKAVDEWYKSLKESTVSNLLKLKLAFEHSHLQMSEEWLRATDDQAKSAITLAENIDKTTKQLEDKLISDDTRRELKENIDDYNDKLNKLKENIVAQNMKKAAEDAGKAFSSDVSSGFKDGIKDLVKGKSTFKEFTAGMLDKVTGSITDTFIEGLTKPLTEKAGGMISDLGKGVFSAGSATFSSLFGDKSFLDSFNSTFGQYTDQGVSANTAETVTVLQRIVKILLGQSAEKAAQDSVSMFAGLSSQIPGLVSAGSPTNQLFGNIASGFNPVSGLWNTSPSTMMNFEGAGISSNMADLSAVSGMPSKIGDSASAMESAFTPKFESMANTMETNMSGALSSDSSIFSTLKTSFSEAFTGIGKLFTEGFGSIGNLFSSGGALSGIGGLFKSGGVFSFLGGFASGGAIRGPGTGTSDSIMAMVSNGEFVVNAKATKEHIGLLQALNSGKTPKFATGGLIGDTSAPVMLQPNMVDIKPVTSANAGSQQMINLTITGDISRQTKAEIYRMLPNIAEGVNNHNKERGHRR
jgi:tape measure domain-containing protein